MTSVYYESICLIYEGLNIVGYSHTYQEAELICNINNKLQWDFFLNEKKGKEILKNIPQIVVSKKKIIKN